MQHKLKKAAESMKITAPDLQELGIIDQIIRECKGGAHHNIEELSAAIDAAIEQSLNELDQLSEEELVNQRYQKYKNIGKYTSVSDISPIE